MKKYDMYRQIKDELTQLDFSMFAENHLRDTKGASMAPDCLYIFYVLGEYGKYTISFRDDVDNVLEDLGIITIVQSDSTNICSQEVICPTRLGLRVMTDLFPKSVNNKSQAYRETKIANNLQTEDVLTGVMLLSCTAICLGISTISLLGSLISILTFLGCALTGLGAIISAGYCSNTHRSLSDPIPMTQANALFKQEHLIDFDEFCRQNDCIYECQLIQSLVKNDAFKAIKQDPYNFLKDYINNKMFNSTDIY